ncbi:FAD-dependent monooxygenase [Kitasatospora sp. RB6PN24]|uniref:FAD-dependent monooxygenase n=1 Tax=Kitasatospora humi TaxID=2893891 RepID=UPI001E571493|nr:FAD-dependent monooxygenase [Kitasatospora humi]MCC9308206.1 FAD-dependent monooxygenase [Kitasatospora humi]
MRIVCAGGGPAGLYFSIMMKRQDPAHEITVMERNPIGSTYGWGVTYWGNLLDRFHHDDPVTAQAISASSVRWSDGVAHICGERVVHHGDQGFSIGRHRLLDILTQRADDLGVRMRFEEEIESVSQLPEADLIVAGDGVNSRLREHYSAEFGTNVSVGRNKYIWLGTRKVFDSFTFAFVETAHGWIWFYAYGFSSDLSTCIVECSPETWTGLGLDVLPQEDSLALLAELFAEPLDGYPLIGRPDGDGRAQWLNFRTLTNQNWYHGNLVLIGDAAHTTHYSIGAGTKLALEDAVGLADALARHDDLPSALDAYERERKFAVLPFQSAARYSAQWYENIPRYMQLQPERLFALLGQRHSPLLPHLPPQVYYRINQVTEQLTALRRLRGWLGPHLARALHGRSLAG